ncbi:MAG: class I SAM-dependent methyltransferase [Microcoleaceae cyanobacterium MO_207.B10]|nr:class I SAM-dependent methyltransferase [Microcoleaceae cyanobacterium MO_207.B10]
MKTDYVGHDRAYQRRQNNPEYAGWMKHEELEEDWQLSWQPLMQKQGFPKQGKLLELGCGAGNISIYFAQAGYDVTGVDIAPTGINWATQNAAKANVNVRFIQGNVLNLTEIPDASFDIALDGRCLHCIIGGDRLLFLQTAHRILKPGGILIINTMCNYILATNNICNFDPKTCCTIHNDIATRYIGDSNDILQEIIEAKFRVLNAEVLPTRDDEVAELQVIAEKI